jgi:hypothetical protein
MTASRCKSLCLAALALFLSAFAFGQDLLSIEIWCEVQPESFAPDADNSPNEAAAYRQLFEEARLIFSGMIYGYSFTYVPLDKTRRVPELLDIKPIAEIPAGDKNLRYVSGDIADNRLYGRFTYTLAGFQSARLESWRTIAVPAEIGRGEGKVYAGAEGKKASREQAIKEALRNYLRPRVFNKPREIRGEAVFLESPIMSLQAGTYRSTVKVKINVKEIVPYSVY